MRIRSGCSILLFCVFYSVGAQATYVDLNFLSFSDTFKSSTTTTISRSMFDLGAGVLMGKSDSWIWALSYGAGNFSDKGTSTTTYTYTDLGIKMGFFWTKQKKWFSTLAYNLESKAKYNDGTNEVELRGTSIKVDIGYAFWVTDVISIAAKVFYYAPTFKESISSGTLTNVSYSRSIIYPSITLIFSY